MKKKKAHRVLRHTFFFVIFIGYMKIDALSLFMNLQKEIDRL